MSDSDLDLLRRFSCDHAQDAFTEIVRRHLNLVYSAAFRQVRAPQLAEEVSQSVFCDLARNANKLIVSRNAPVLAAWLYQVAHRTAVDVVRKESRRQLREQIAADMNTMNAPEAGWPEIEPLLDKAVAELEEADRAAVLLRYFENKSLREVGAQLGISDDAAQKRVTRSVDKLREFFSKRKIAVGAGGLTILISANAVQSAPVGLAGAISAAAFAGTAATVSTVIAATTKTIAMTTLQKTLVTATVAVLAGAGIYQTKQAHDARAKAGALLQQQAPLAEQVWQLQNSFADATNRLADLLAENARLKTNPHELELLKLRGTVTTLRNDAAQMDDPVVKQALKRKANVERMKQLFLEHPEQKIPEMQMLSDGGFFDLARDQDLESSNGIRKAFSEIRFNAENQFVIKLQEALQKFCQTNSNQPPNSILALVPLFDPPTDQAILERYHVIETGNLTVGGWSGGWAISQKETPDPDYDRQWFVSPFGLSNAPFTPPEKY